MTTTPTGREVEAATARPRRPWWRLHASTLLLLVPVVAVLAAMMVPGQAMKWVSNVGTGVSMGWPFIYATGAYREVVDGGGAPWMSWQLWFLPERWLRFFPAALAKDVGIAIGVLAMAALVLEWRRRRRHSVWQFSLGEGLLAMLVAALLAAWLGWAKHGYDRQQNAIEMLAPYRAVVSTMQYDEYASYPEYSGPTWLRRLLPMEYCPWFERYRSMSLTCGKQPAATCAAVLTWQGLGLLVPSGQMPVEAIAELTSLTQLVLIGESWTDDDLRFLAEKLPLRHVLIDAPNVREAGVVAIAQMPTLTSLTLSRVVPGDRGIEALCESPTLREFFLDNSTISEDQVVRLAGAKHLTCVFINSCDGLPDMMLSSELALRVQALRPDASISGHSRGIFWEPDSDALTEQGGLTR